MKKIKILLILVVIFQLGACAQNLSLVKTERVNINDLYSVRPNINFNQLADAKITVWTVNGFGLDRIVFINNIKDGETLFGDDTTNTYKKDMNEVEIAELFIESMKVFGKWADGKFENLKLINAENKSTKFQYCPIISGTSLLDQIKSLNNLNEIKFEGIAYPLLFLPFVSRASEIIGKRLLLKLDSNEFLLNFNNNIFSNFINLDDLFIQLGK